jgi:cytochrome c oxidase assembly factor CtaG
VNHALVENVSSTPSASVHALQHSAFFFTALLFWNVGARDSAARAPSLFWLFLTMLHALALLPPLASISAETFSGHMLQHEVLMVTAAPLLVLGRPLAIWVWSFTDGWRRIVASPARWRKWRRVWSFVTAPLAATILHGAAIWIWHAPPLFAAAEANVWDPAWRGPAHRRCSGRG